jgi:hypothetical protein
MLLCQEWLPLDKDMIQITLWIPLNCSLMKLIQLPLQITAEMFFWNYYNGIS